MRRRIAALARNPTSSLSAGSAWTFGASGIRHTPAVVLLHELPGLYDEDLALARCLSREGLSIYTPRIFGRFGRRDDAGGLLDACVLRLGGPPFACYTLSTRSAVLDRLEPLCDGIAKIAGGSIGVLGMCLTGILPLALLPNHVAAAVVCQPTLPFSITKRRPDGAQKTDLGLGAADYKEALDSPVPFLAMHYNKDPLSPVERIARIASCFGDRVAVIDLAGNDKHSSLAGDLDPDAFADTVAYLRVMLKAQTGPARMKSARLAGRPCEITSEGWRAV